MIVHYLNICHPAFVSQFPVESTTFQPNPYFQMMVLQFHLKTRGKALCYCNVTHNPVTVKERKSRIINRMHNGSTNAKGKLWHPSSRKKKKTKTTLRETIMERAKAGGFCTTRLPGRTLELSQLTPEGIRALKRNVLWNLVATAELFTSQSLERMYNFCSYGQLTVSTMIPVIW